MSRLYSNRATQGVELIAGKIETELRPKFGLNISFIRPSASKKEILDKIDFVARNLDKNGVFFFYFHGHGDTIRGRLADDEDKDQALVCRSNFLIDDTLDIHFRKFKASQRILSIVDSCSSESVVEWSQFKWTSYPKIIHIASSLDGQRAFAYTNGGILSNKLWDLFYNGQYNNWTYAMFIKKIKELRSVKCLVKQTDNVNRSYLNTKLFN